ncbi:MAG TPA: hypothetical protein VGU66_22455 [Candidatus Elarobacter sp.]|nr:hypothetical protein [Candidatus Elarobacter sp.]
MTADFGATTLFAAAAQIGPRVSASRPAVEALRPEEGRATDQARNRALDIPAAIFSWRCESEPTISAKEAPAVMNT